MSTTHTSESGQDLLANMARIPLIIPGTLSERRGSDGKINGWKLQRWHNGRNQTRYIPAAQVERIRQGTQGHEQFMTLAQQYVEVKGQQALSALDTPTDSKKKPMRR
jgi:hypothetical protein